VRVGVYLPILSAASRDAILTYARVAESLGFDSLWTNSHIAVPVTFGPGYPYSDDHRPPWNATSSWLDAMTTLSFVAAATERVRIGVAVVPLITTDPLTLAKQAATIDVLSNGRFELGIGAGWLAEEGRALGHPTDRRTARMEETIAILRKAWDQPTFEHRGRFWDLPPVGINPKPRQGAALPLWIGGHGDEAVRIAAQNDAGLFIWLPRRPERLAEYHRKLRARSKTAPLAASLALAEVDGHWLEAAREMRDAGADLLVVMRRYDDRAVDDLTRFAVDVLPELVD
jgi:probable F420-dependent oxidoreductase